MAFYPEKAVLMASNRPLNPVAGHDACNAGLHFAKITGINKKIPANRLYAPSLSLPSI
jgi:hypothetical protein